ncbi:MAG: DUF1778 domain-containing protein [Candidatus Dormibacteria bacterium]
MEATERLELRLAPEQKAALTTAANLMDTTVTDLVRDSALERANEVIIEHTTTFVPASYFDQLLAALDNPVPGNAALRRALTAATDVVDRRQVQLRATPRRSPSRRFHVRRAGPGRKAQDPRPSGRGTEHRPHLCVGP